jgi:PAS domain S-box-containing protein
MPEGHLDSQLTGVTADIALRQMTARLRESEARFRGAFEAAAVGIAMVALDGRWLEINRALCEIVGYTELELLATTFQAITHPDDLTADVEQVRRLVNGDLPNYQLEKRYLHKSGRAVSVHLSVSLVRDASGQALYLVAMVQDITARREAEQDRALFYGQSLTPMCVLDYDGNLRRVNPAIEATFGFSSDELLTKSFLEFVHPEDRARSSNEVRKIVEGAESRAFELRGRCKDGSYKWPAMDAVPCVEQRAFYAIGHDVTDRHVALEALAESERFVRSTLDALSTHIAILDERGFILATNRAWREFALANSAQAIGDVGANYLDVCDQSTGRDADEAADMATGIRAVIRGQQENFTLEYPCHSPLERRWFMARATRFDGDGPVRVVISHENISATKLADEERQKFVSLVENSTDFIGMATLSGEVIYTNSAADKLVSFDPALHPNRPRVEHFYTEAGKRVLEEIALPAMMATGRWEGEIQFRHFRTGQPIETASSLFIVRHPKSGEPLCMATVTRDITERKRAGEALAERVRLAALTADVGLALTHEATTASMLQKCSEAIVRHAGAAFARIWTLNAAEQMLELQASAGLYTHIDGKHARIPLGQFKIGKIAQSRQPHLTNEVIGDPQVPEQEWAQSEGMISFAGYPLVVEDQLIGVVALFGRQPLTETTLTALASVADGIALGTQRRHVTETMHLNVAAMGAAANGIAITDVNGVMEWINPAFTKLTGYSADECIGRSLNVLKQGTLTPELNEQLWKTIRAGQVWRGDVVNKRKDGSLFNVEITITPVRSATGQITHLVAIKQDITERKRSEETLQKSEEELRTLTETIPNIVWMTRPDGWNIYCNQRWVEYTGLSLEATAGLGWDAAYHPDDRQSAVDTWNRASETGEPYENESRLRGADGSYRWFINRGLPLRDNSGQITRWFGTCTDIDHQKRISVELQEARNAAEVANRAKQEQVEELEYLYETAPVGLELIDRDFRIVRVNERLAVLNGKTVREHIGRTLREVVPQFAPDIEAAVERVFTTGKSLLNIEMHGTTPADHTTERDWLVSYYPVKSPDGQPRFVGCVVLEITALKQVERDLRQTKIAADSANQAKSQFLANMSHEIRTPMNGIIGLTGLTLDTELAPEQREYLDGVMLSAESLLKLINSILDFSRIEAGKMELEQINFDLRNTLGPAVKTLALRAHQKELELLYEVRPEIPDALIGDPARLCQVVINLIGNALKFTQQGEIAVLVELEEIWQDAVSLRFTVQDTGIGIPADKQVELFQPFTQADSSTTREYGGTGLGLTISARLAELLGGRIWFESEEGHGSAFHFTARFGLQASPVARQSPLLPSDVIGLRVLVVDDNATNRRILQEQLTRWEMKPTVVDSGSTALKCLNIAAKEQAPFELILLDVQMTEMDGFSVLEHIRALPEIDRPTILMLSSVDRRGDIARARELGAAAYLHKPVNPQDLLDSITATLGHVRSNVRSSNSSAKPSGRQRKLRILVTEDNQVNQLLAVRTLEKAGHSVAVANNGEEAVAARNRESFDVILMDIQMPVVDGFQATARIREQEQETGQHIPIVAMTAHAIKGDRERCLKAGMDGYVSKPIRAHDLFTAIEDVVKDRQQSPLSEDEENALTTPPDENPQPLNTPEQEPIMSPPSVPLDSGAGPSDDPLTGDAELRRELSVMFLEDCPKLLSEIRTALDQRDGPSLRLAAHTLKGSAGIFRVQSAFDAALRMEHLGQNCDWDHAEEAWTRVNIEMANLSATLADLTDSTATAASPFGNDRA